MALEEGAPPVSIAAPGPRAARRPREEAEGHEHPAGPSSSSGPPLEGRQDGAEEDEEGEGQGNVLMTMFLDAEKSIKRRRCVP